MNLSLFLSVFLIVGLKKKQLLLVPLSKDFWASSDYHVFDLESRLIQCSVYWAFPDSLAREGAIYSCFYVKKMSA